MSSAATVRENQRDLPLFGRFDVVVCGGGPSGIMAAIAAARSGAYTLLVERYGFLGGMATAGLVGPISKFNLNGRRIVGGLPLEFVEAMAAADGAIVNLPSGNVPFDPEVYKTTAFRLAAASGVQLLLHCVVAGSVEGRPGEISKVILESPSGRIAVGCGVAIDCTGSGRLIQESSLSLRYRSSGSRDLQPMSLVFRLGGVDTDALEVLMTHDGTKYRNTTLRRYLQEAMEEGRIANFGGPWAVWGSVIRRGYVSVNATRHQGEATDPRDITQAEVAMRLEIDAIVEAFRRNAPEFGSCYLIDVATQVGVRETRRIDGLYTLTADDLLEPPCFPDTVALGGHPVDIHHSDRPDQTVNFLDRPYNIPFRTIVPKGSVNLLASGGIVSATREAFASVRVQAQCMALGQAAGTAAAMCAEKKVAIGEIDTRQIAERLRGAGVITDAPQQ